MDPYLIFLFFWTKSAAAASTKCENSTNSSEENVGALSGRKCLEYYPDPEFPIMEVAGGNLSLAREFPHMAVIGYGDENDIQWQCGGTLISKKFVMTAAHCVDRNSDPPKFVRLGDLDLSTEDDDAQTQDFNITRVFPHPSYSPPAKYHDIALLELDREVNFTEYASPACLNTEKELNETRLTATGWGRVGYIDDASSYLFKVFLDHVPHDQCVKAFGKYSEKYLPNGIIDDFQLCAGRVKGQDTCQGDSGGPLQMKNGFGSCVHTVYAVTSFGKACALSSTPGIYTRVSNYIPWIESIAWKNESKSN